MAKKRISALAAIAAGIITANTAFPVTDMDGAPKVTYRMSMAQARTKLFAGGAGYTASDPLVVGAITAGSGTAALQAITGTTLVLSSTLAATTATLSALAGGLVFTGATPATVGLVRLPNANHVYARNAANSADIHVIGTTAGNLVQIDASGNGTTFGAGISATTGALTTSLAIGGSPAASGPLRIPNGNGGLRARNAGNSADIALIDVDGTNTVQIGNAAAAISMLVATAFSDNVSVVATKKVSYNAGLTTYTSETSAGAMVHVASASVSYTVNGVAALTITDRVQFGLMGTANSSAGNVLITNSSAPGGNPTGGGFLWVEAGALKYRGTSGTVTTVALA